MHRSRLQSLVIDCDDLEAGIAFWTRALGTEVLARDAPYVSLKSPQPGLKLLLQSVCEPKTAKSRVHLDIETDDVEAESLRLESFGARRTAHLEGWNVMEDPCGNEFCVVPIFDQGFGGEAREWDVDAEQTTPFSLSS